MSGIFGVVATGDQPVDRDRFGALSAAMQFWGDATPRIVLGERAAMGMHLFHSLPEDVHTSLPALSPERGLSFTAEGRVDNRAEVAAALGLDGAELQRTADTTLVHLAYLRWGADCDQHLVGDWSFAAWHDHERRLVLQRDRSGWASLVFWHDAATGLVAFASDPNALRHAGAPQRRNDLYLAQLLVSWQAYHGTQTIHLDLHRVPPGNAVTIDRDGWRAERRWFPEQMEATAFGSLDECAEALKAELDAAVTACCRGVGPLAATLSGGLDSGSVTALAARHLGDGRPLRAYTHVPLPGSHIPDITKRFGDERHLAAASAAAAGVTEHHFLDCAEVSPVDGIVWSIEHLREPVHAATNAFWLRDLVGRAAADGARVLLTGQSGNATISWVGAPTGFSDRMRRRGWRGAVAPMVPAWLLRQRASRADFAASAINPTFAQQLGLSRAWADALGQHPTRPLPTATPNAVRASWHLPGSNRIGDLWTIRSARQGIDVRDPLTNWRLTEFCYRVPDSLVRTPDGVGRAPLRRALFGLLPDEVRLNQRRGLQASDLIDRMAPETERVEATLASLRAGAAAEVLAVDRMAEVWHAAQARPDANATHRVGSVLLRGMMAGLWLQR